MALYFRIFMLKHLLLIVILFFKICVFFSRIPEFGNTVEGILENTFLNILSEALEGEFNITARPRFIALPKRNGSGSSKGGKP